MLMDFKEGFSSIKKEKKKNMYFGSLVKSYESIIDITKKV